MIACVCGSTSCVRLLLQDHRVKVNESDHDGATTLCWAAKNGHLDVIKWWIASGREMDLGKPGKDKTDAIGVAKADGKTEVKTLLKAFKSSATKTRAAVRKELGITGSDPLAFFFFYLLNFNFPFSPAIRFPCVHPTKAHQGRVPHLP